MNRARKLLCGLALLTPCLFMAGCLIPYAYPKLSYVPGNKLDPQVTDIHAFRVEVTADQIDLGEKGPFTLTAIQPRSDGSFPAQANLSVERGVYVVGVAVNYNTGRSHATRVRLYRPGYQLVEIPAWGALGAVKWQAAPDWTAQEKAVDDLLRRPCITPSAAALANRTESPWVTDNRSNNLPRLVHSPVRSTQAMLFAASEYERVAVLAPTPEEATRLRERARQLTEMNR